MEFISTGFLTLSVMALIVVARVVFGIICRLEGFSFSREMVENDNPAIGVRVGLFLLAVIFSFLGIIHPSGVGWKEDLNIIAGYGLLAVGLLIVSRWVNDYLILFDFRNNKEVLEEKNTAVAIVEGATYLATAFIMAGALAGWHGGFWIALSWFGIGQGFLIVLGLLYRVCFAGIGKVGKAIDTHNDACALSFGGFLLSGGIALGAAISGPFTGWTSDLTGVGMYIGLWVVFMFIAGLTANYFVLPATRLREEVMDDKNIAAGIIEAVMFIAPTLFYVKVW